jgi:hypothetical protein
MFARRHACLSAIPRVLALATHPTAHPICFLAHFASLFRSSSALVRPLKRVPYQEIGPALFPIVGSHSSANPPTPVRLKI